MANSPLPMDSNFGIPTKGSLKTRRPGDICQKMESGFFHGFLAMVTPTALNPKSG